MANLRQYKSLITAGEVISKSFTNANTDPYLISDNNLIITQLNFSFLKFLIKKINLK